ncbi:MAG: acetylglutamate kinase [Deltaproteobacteria bacterium]|nr:acetylglutamate kinase [Deltaproteobacteria bacterium]
MSEIESQEKAEILVEALPFIKRYSGKVVVLKVGGEMLENHKLSESLTQDLILLKSVGLQVVLCHGGGPQVTESMRQLGKQSCFVEGLRVTDAETIDITAMVFLGRINAHLTALINTHGAHAVGLSGVDARLFEVECEDPKLGFVGKIRRVNTALIIGLLQSGFLPVISPLGADAKGDLYNINADLTAGELAAALGAEKLVILTNVAGLYESFGRDDTLVSETNAEKLREMLRSKAASEGMRPKLQAILRALEAGVPRAHMLDGRVAHALLLEIFTPQGIGTLITNEGGHAES